jgi:hypothetical protein
LKKDNTVFEKVIADLNNQINDQNKNLELIEIDNNEKINILNTKFNNEKQEILNTIINNKINLEKLEITKFDYEKEIKYLNEEKNDNNVQLEK